MSVKISLFEITHRAIDAEVLVGSVVVLAETNVRIQLRKMLRVLQGNILWIVGVVDIGTPLKIEVVNTQIVCPVSEWPSLLTTPTHCWRSMWRMQQYNQLSIEFDVNGNVFTVINDKI